MLSILLLSPFQIFDKNIKRIILKTISFALEYSFIVESILKSFSEKESRDFYLILGFEEFFKRSKNRKTFA